MGSHDPLMIPLGSADFSKELITLARALVLGPSRIRQAITPSLSVSVGAERFAIPRVSVSELIHIPAERARKHIEMVGKTEVLNYRGSIIPLIRLADALGIERIFLDENGKAMHDRRERIADRRAAESVIADDAHQWDERTVGEGRRRNAASDLKIVVVNNRGMRYGLVVDELFPDAGPGSEQVTHLK